MVLVGRGGSLLRGCAHTGSGGQTWGKGRMGRIWSEGLVEEQLQGGHEGCHRVDIRVTLGTRSRSVDRKPPDNSRLTPVESRSPLGPWAWNGAPGTLPSSPGVSLLPS